MAFNIKFNEEKNQVLRATRGIGFNDVLISIADKKLLANIKHPNSRRPNQRMYVIEINGYAYAVPYVVDMKKSEIFLKTLYPSRVLTKKYLKKEDK